MHVYVTARMWEKGAYWDFDKNLVKSAGTFKMYRKRIIQSRITLEWNKILFWFKVHYNLCYICMLQYDATNSIE